MQSPLHVVTNSSSKKIRFDKKMKKSVQSSMIQTLYLKGIFSQDIYLFQKFFIY